MFENRVLIEKYIKTSFLPTLTSSSILIKELQFSKKKKKNDIDLGLFCSPRFFYKQKPT